MNWRAISEKPRGYGSGGPPETIPRNNRQKFQCTSERLSEGYAAGFAQGTSVITGYTWTSRCTDTHLGKT